MSLAAWPPQLIVTRPLPATEPGASSAYVDLFWTPLVGGTGVALYRALTRIAAASPGGAVTLDDLASLIGERAGDGLERTWGAMGTLEAEGAVARTGPDLVSVPLDLPLLRSDQANRLPLVIRDVHPDWLTTLQVDDLQSAAMDGFFAVASFLDEALSDRTTSPLRSLQRWQHVIRMASDFHDDLIAGLTPPHQRAASRDLTRRCRALGEALRRAQRDQVIHDAVDDDQRADVRQAAAAVLEWATANPPRRSPEGDAGPGDAVGVDEPGPGADGHGGPQTT